MLGADKIPAGYILQRDLLGIVVLQILNGIFDIMPFFLCWQKLIRMTDQQKEEHMGIAFKYVFAKAVFVGVFLFDFTENLFNTVHNAWIAVQIQQRGKYRFDHCGEKV